MTNGIRSIAMLFATPLFEFGHASKFNELFNGIVLYPEEGSIAKTSV